MARRKKKLPKKTLAQAVMTFTLIGLGFVVAGMLLGKLGIPMFSGMANTESDRLVWKVNRQVQALAGSSANVFQEKTVARVALPGTVHPQAAYQRLTQTVYAAGGEVMGGSENRRTGELMLEYGRDGKTLGRVILGRAIAQPSKAIGRIALVIDDFGYKRDDVVERFLNLPFAVTYAIIPGLRHSTAIAKAVHQRGAQVIIHMPMEPLSGSVEDGNYTLLTSLSAAEVKSRVRAAIAALPHATGVSNHMGSKATADSIVMRAAVSEVGAASYFFLDSRTSPNSVAYSSAQRTGVTSFQNDLFLDPENTQEAILKKLNRLAALAEQKGMAIGIGHPYANTLAVLEQHVPRLQQAGFEFVYVYQPGGATAPGGPLTSSIQ